MKKIYLGFVVLLLALFSFGAGDMAYASGESGEATQTEQKDDTHCDNAFSLYKALSYAQDTNDPKIPNSLPGATKSKGLQREAAVQGFTGLLQRIINGFTGIAAAIAVFFIVFNGGSLMLAAGDSEKIKKARTGIVWALLGLLLIMGSYIIAKTVISLTYSGATVEVSGEADGRNLDDCDDYDGKTTPAETGDTKETTETPGFCEAKPQLPPSCYAGGYGSSFDANRGTDEADCNRSVQANEEVQKMCEPVLGQSNCFIGDLQAELAKGGHYDGLGSQCQPADGNHSDGEYGTCTIGAMEKFIEAKCSE